MTWEREIGIKKKSQNMFRTYKILCPYISKYEILLHINANFFAFKTSDVRDFWRVPELAYAIICYILASKHNNTPLPNLAIILQYRPKFRMVL